MSAPYEHPHKIDGVIGVDGKPELIDGIKFLLV